MTNLIITVLLAFSLLVLFYRCAVRPLFRLAFLERIEASEKQLEKMVGLGKINRTDFTYLFLAHKFQVKRHLGQIGVSGFLHFLICRDGNDESVAETKKFTDEASPELLKMHYELRRDLLRWMVLNSPSYSIIGAGVVVCVMLYKSMNEKRVMDEAFTFADIEASASSC